MLIKVKIYKVLQKRYRYKTCITCNKVKGQMAEKLTVQQLSTLNTYLKKHPDAKREDAIKLLFDGSNAKQTEKGVKVEHNKSDKKQTITLKSGLSVDVAKGTTVETKEGKITLSKTGRYSVTGKDGKTKYYAANGKELNEKYFKQVESSTGNVVVKNSKGVNIDVNKRLQNRIARASKELKHEEDNHGWMGKLWSGTKNTFGFGDSSDKVKEQLKQEQKLLKQFNQQPQNRAKIFKQLTGLEYNTKNMQDFVEGKIQLQSEKNLDGYKEGQKIAVDVASDVVSGVASFGVYTAAVAAAPFTGGTSIAVGVAAAGVIGAGVKAGLKASDTIGTDKKYDSLGSDLLMGSVNGAIAPLTAGAGGAVAKTVAVRAGVQVVKETGKQATKQVISQTTKNAAKQGFARTFKTNLAESIVQPNNYKLVGGTLTKRLGAYASEGAVDGALSGGAYSGVETAKNGGSAGEILQATALGFGMGAFMGGAMTSLAHSKGIVTGNKNATKTTDKYPQLTEIDKIARHDEINQANLSPHRFSDVSGKKAQKQVSDYLDHLLSIIPENTPEANNVNKVKKYADFILPDGTLISRNHAGDTGIPVMNPTTGQWEIPDVENAVLFWIKDVEGKEHVLPALTPENVSKAKRIIEYMSSQTEIPRENINTVQKEFLNKIKPNPKEITQDAVETSVVKETDNTVPTPKPQGDSSLAPSGRGLGRGADDITPTPKSQGVVSSAISQTEHALTASELQAIQKSIKQLPFMTEIEDKPAFYNKIIEKIQAAVTKNANGDMKLIQSRISKIDGTNCKSYIVRNAKNIDIILDNAKEINEIYDNICDEFVWTSNDVIMGINKDNFQEVLKASRLVKKGDQDAINYLYYVDYSQNPHTVKYGDTTVEVDTQDIIALLSTRQAYDSEKFDREISKLFSKNVDMQEKKAYGKSFAGIIEQKPELLEIAEKTKHMSEKEYRDYINNLFAENKLDKNLTLHMRKHPELSKNVSVKETIQDTTPKPQGASSEINIPQGKFAAPNTKFAETDEAFRTIVTRRKSDIQELRKRRDQLRTGQPRHHQS